MIDHQRVCRDILEEENLKLLFHLTETVGRLAIPAANNSIAQKFMQGSHRLKVSRSRSNVIAATGRVKTPNPLLHYTSSHTLSYTLRHRTSDIGLGTEDFGLRPQDFRL